MATTDGQAGRSDDRSADGESADAEPAEGETDAPSADRTPSSPTRRLRWRVVLVDALVGVICLGVGLSAGATAMGRLWWLAFATGVIFVAGLYAAERGATADLDETTRLAVLGAVLAAIALAAAVALIDAGPDAMAAVALLGVGIGLLLYRFAFGILLPVPRERLRRAAERSIT